MVDGCLGGNAPAAALAGTQLIDRPPEDNPPPPGDDSTAWTYDAVGNRLTETNYLGTKTYAYDAADRLTAVTGLSPTSYTYDASGNELSAGSTTYAYDLADRLVSASVGNTTETYTWSGDGIRLSSSTGSPAAKTVRFAVDRAFALPTVVIERDGANKTLRRYTYGLDLLSQTTPTKGPYWYHHDGLGSVSDITSATGTSLAWAEYTPYGAPRASASTSQAPVNPFRFSGQYLDATSGLYHLRARQYDPATGRFTALDPQPGGVAEPYVNAYGYANSNPVRYVDPSGECWQFLGAAGAGAATGPGEAIIGPTGLALFGACVLFVVVAIETTARTAVQLNNADRWWAEPSAGSLFKGATRRDLERELRDAGYLPKPGSGRGGEEVWERPGGGRPISLPRHKDISPGVTKQIRDILRNLSAIAASGK